MFYNCTNGRKDDFYKHHLLSLVLQYLSDENEFVRHSLKISVSEERRGNKLPSAAIHFRLAREMTKLLETQLVV